MTNTHYIVSLRQAAAEAELLAAQTKMATIEAQRQAEAPQVANLEKETEEIANSIVELNKIQADLQAKVRMLAFGHTVPPLIL